MAITFKSIGKKAKEYEQRIKESIERKRAESKENKAYMNIVKKQAVVERREAYAKAFKEQARIQAQQKAKVEARRMYKVPQERQPMRFNPATNILGFPMAQQSRQPMRRTIRTPIHRIALNANKQAKDISYFKISNNRIVPVKVPRIKRKVHLKRKLKIIKKPTTQKNSFENDFWRL